MPSPSRVDPSEGDVIHLDFESQWGAQCSIMVVPDHFKLSRDLKQNIVEDKVIEQLYRMSLEPSIDNLPNPWQPALKEDRLFMKVNIQYDNH